MVKFAGIEYNGDITLEEFVRRREIESLVIFSINREPTAQEVIDGS